METVLFDSPVVKIEAFQLAPSEERFHRTGYVQNPVAVFPKHPIWIKHEGKQAFVADTSMVNFYNADQVYSRSLIDPKGDFCHCFSLHKDILREQLGVDKTADEMFDFQHLPSSRTAFLLQLGILGVLPTADSCQNDLADTLPGSDAMAIEEQTITLFTKVFEPIIENSRNRAKSTGNLRQKKLVERIKSSLQEKIYQQLSLSDLAQQHHLSVYHLSRIFKQHCGIGISQYRLQQRLRAASLAVLQGENLTTLALEHGFSSHSHLTASFRHYFGCTPSEFRRSQYKRSSQLRYQ